MNGIEFAKRIREIDKKIKIWLLTGFTSNSITNDPVFVSTNIERVIEKPIPIDKLVDMVKSASTS